MLLWVMYLMIGKMIQLELIKKENQLCYKISGLVHQSLEHAWINMLLKVCFKVCTTIFQKEQMNLGILLKLLQDKNFIIGMRNQHIFIIHHTFKEWN